jgi:hypothetical protein
MKAKRRLSKVTLTLLCTVVLGVPSAVSGRTIYVDDNAAGAQDGSSWLHAFSCLQNALAVAKSGDEIRVAQGVYRPARPGLGSYPSRTDREATFRLTGGLTVLGGFAGLGYADPNWRDPSLCATILSGDLRGDDEPNTPLRFCNDNSFTVVTATGDPSTLDGVTVTRAVAHNRAGGGVSCPERGFTARNCTFLENYAEDEGGGIRSFVGTVHLENCRFVRNESLWCGGGLSNHNGTVIAKDCEFIDNRALDGGGGIYHESGHALFVHCLFHGNSSRDGSGAIHSSGWLSLQQCTFADNRGQGDAGAVACHGDDADIDHCLFYNNSARDQGAIFVGAGSHLALDYSTLSRNFTTQGPTGGIYCQWPYHDPPAEYVPGGTLTARNCIFWDNYVFPGARPDGQVMSYLDQINADPNVTAVRYCCISGWTPDYGGEGNIGADPLFAAPDQNDFHLKSQAGRWDAASRTWVTDEVTSPCIDAGGPLAPVGDEPQPNGGRLNMGVYGGTWEASITFPVGPTAGQWSEPVPLTEVNLGDAEEWSPVLSADGLTLYFCRVNGPESDLGRIFQATRPAPTPDSHFTSVIKVPGTLNLAQGHVLSPWVAPDGLRLYYTYQTDNVFRLMVSARAPGSARWMTGKVISELDQLSSRLITCRLTADELFIYFGGPDRQGGGAEYDIWKATRRDRNDPFDAPVNMDWLNSPANDLHAAPSADGLTLYFASERSGRYQLFRSTRANRNVSFGPPVHLAFFDTPTGHSMFPYLSPDGQEFYFVRQTGEDRRTRDIWVSYRLD